MLVNSMRSFFTLKYVALATLMALNGYVWYSYTHAASQELTVSILDVGQGDAIFIESPTGVQVLIDGGPDDSVSRQLPKQMNLLDRSIDLIVETHPDKDHIAGLPHVLERYRVAYFMSPGITDRTATAEGLGDAVHRERGLRELRARRGMRIHMGGGAYADVLYPDRDVSEGDTNEGSIIMRLVYEDTAFMLTGDASSEIEAYLLALHAGTGTLASTVLKAGHHGSKYSTSEEWLAALDPKIVAISAGAGNRYGHPSPDVLARIASSRAEAVSTIDQGTIHFVSDGERVWMKN
jgi:competence protein ComEC